MLIDTGYPATRTATSIACSATIKQAGLTKLDYLLVTHYHKRSRRQAAAIAAKVPIGTFIDHGETVETTDEAKALYADYLKARATGRHMLAKPGGKVADPRYRHDDRDRGGRADPASARRARTADATVRLVRAEGSRYERERAIGRRDDRIRPFRMIDLGDLTWNKELRAGLPSNLLGTVDVYLTTHHGLDQSNVPVIVHTLKPRVAIMNNGPAKGGSVEAMRAIRSSPRSSRTFWQLHFSVAAGKRRERAGRDDRQPRRVDGALHQA
jgi:hypothetical protein